MGGTAQPWFDKQKNQWTVWFGGRRERLATGRKNKKAAPAEARRTPTGSRQEPRHPPCQAEQRPPGRSDRYKRGCRAITGRTVSSSIWPF